MTALLCILGYAVVGGWYGRTQVIPCYRAAKVAWRYEDMARESMHMRVAWRVAAWPVAMVLDAVRPAVARWFMAQLDDEEKP